MRVKFLGKVIRFKNCKSPGFTLVEIMTVIAIIGILAALIFVATQSTLASGRDARRQGELVQVKKVLQQYYLANNSYPITNDPAGISLENDSDTNGTFTQTMKGGGYLPLVPRDPKYTGPTGEYAYKYIATTTDSYTLCAKSESKGGYICTTQASDGVALSADALVFGEWGGTFVCGGPLTDSRDGKIYDTALINGQCWFADNINVGTRVDGSGDQGVSCSNIQKYCYNNQEANCTLYGGLYQWNQAMCGYSPDPSQGICPDGWHVPRDSEWYALENYLKDSGQTCDGSRDGNWDCATAGDKLRTGNFQASFSGYINNRSFTGQGDIVYYWSSTPQEPYAFTRLLMNPAGNPAMAAKVYREKENKYFAGTTVRCLQD